MDPSLGNPDLNDISHFLNSTLWMKSFSQLDYYRNEVSTFFSEIKGILSETSSGPVIYLFICLHQTPRSIDKQRQGKTTQETKAEHHEKKSEVQ